MGKSVIIYQADQEVIGKHLRSNQWIMYSGKLTIYDREKSPITLKIKSEIYDSFLSMGMDDKKEFKGDSVTEVYAKLSKWYYSRGILFKN
ncbi:hypothetical protein [uncultured Cytophaga sp.]|uniref:hypothetical protein n=1 Tax=uncultured Cytophaga sp. TaxID=160238 RepID=UPI002636B339|nr:hypothetical protein [uncultured Cytophaga sp.]